MSNDPDIQAKTVVAEKEEWNHAEDQHERTERQVTEEMALNQKASAAAKTDPKSTESKGKPVDGDKPA